MRLPFIRKKEKEKKDSGYEGKSKMVEGPDVVFSDVRIEYDPIANDESSLTGTVTFSGFRSLNDLESKIGSNPTLENRIEITEGDTKVIYIGRAEELHFEGFNIHGYARLRKTVITNGKGEDVWEVSSDGHNRCFIYDGQISDGYTYTVLEYRTDLLSKLTTKGVVLSHQVFDAVFGPIEEQLQKRYLAVKSFHDGSQSR